MVNIVSDKTAKQVFLFIILKLKAKLGMRLHAQKKIYIFEGAFQRYTVSMVRVLVNKNQNR